MAHLWTCPKGHPPTVSVPDGPGRCLVCGSPLIYAGAPLDETLQPGGPPVSPTRAPVSPAAPITTTPQVQAPEDYTLQRPASAAPATKSPPVGEPPRTAPPQPISP